MSFAALAGVLLVAWGVIWLPLLCRGRRGSVRSVLLVGILVLLLAGCSEFLLLAGITLRCGLMPMSPSDCTRKHIEQVDRSHPPTRTLPEQAP